LSFLDAFGKPPVVFAPGSLNPQAYAGPKAPADDSAHESPRGDSLMSPAELHADSIVIDGLIIAKWNRELFEDMRKGGLTAANCTVSVWEGFQATINSICTSQKLMRENSDLVIPVRTTADIRKAKEQGKTGILFGFQNAHAYEDQIGYVEIFKQLGVGIVQMCYNT
jgi:membrane dipeptidase